MTNRMVELSEQIESVKSQIERAELGEIKPFEYTLWSGHQCSVENFLENINDQVDQAKENHKVLVIDENEWGELCIIGLSGHSDKVIQDEIESLEYKLGSLQRDLDKAIEEDRLRSETIKELSKEKRYRNYLELKKEFG